MRYFFSALMFLFIGSLIACSQSSKKGETVEEIVRYHENKQTFQDLAFFREIEIIPFQIPENEEIMLSGNLELMEYRGEYYVVDKIQHFILRFDSTGNYLNKIGRRGRGSQEYLGIHDVEINSKVVSIFSGQDKRLYNYSKEGDFISTTEIPYIARKVISSETGFWVYLGYKNQYLDERVIRIDNDGEVECKILPSKANVLTVDEDAPVFLKDGGQLFFRESLSKNIYRIEDCRDIIAYQVDYGKYEIPEDYFRKNDPFVAAEYLFEREFAFLSRFLSSKEYIAIESTIQKGSDITIAYGVKKKEDKKWDWVNYEMSQQNRDIFAGTLKEITPASEFLFLVDSYILLSGIKTVLPIKNREVLNDLNAESNPVILKCIPK